MKAKVVTLPRQKTRTITVKRPRSVPMQTRGPRGDMENFSFARWLLAKKEELSTGKKTIYTAPYETAYYKAQAELNGQDGGYLAPEEWRAEYFKVLRGGLILNKLP